MWIELLQTAENSELHEQQMRAHAEDAGLENHNRSTLMALVHARRNASMFLRRRAAEVNGDAAELLERVSRAFADEVEVLEDVGNPDWNPEDRARQAVALGRAQEIEATCIGLLQQAVHTM